MVVEYAERESVLKKYAGELSKTAGVQAIQRATLGEPALIVAGPSVQGVQIKFLDLSSQSCSGTFKDWVACLTIAYCLENGIHRFVTQSSGNTANALALYAEHAGITMVALYPRASRFKIDGRLANHSAVTMIEVDHPEPQIKLWADEMASRYKVPWLPRLDLQRAGNKLRAYFINDWLTDSDAECHWHAQSLSSAFGPLGTYEGFAEASLAGRLHHVPPKFLGIQQEAVQPFAVHMGTALATDLTPEAAIEPTLFRTQPTSELLDGIRAICDGSGGTVRVVANDTVARRTGEACAILESSGFGLAKVIDPVGRERLLELAGVICIVGVIEAVESGIIHDGEVVLATMTGGLSPRPRARFEPRHRVSREEGTDKLWSIVDHVFDVRGDISPRRELSGG